MKLVVLLLVGLWCFATPSVADGADYIYVSVNTNGTQDGTKDHPYESFSAALNSDSIKSGTHIIAFPGTYTGSDNYNLLIDDELSLAFVTEGSGAVIIDFSGLSVGFLLVSSEGLPFAVEGYIFQNQAQGSNNAVLSFKKTEETLVSGCTFQNVGFAVSMVDVEQISIQESFFESVISPSHNGPALFSQDSAGTIQQSLFVNCEGINGGAIYVDGTPSSNSVEFLFVTVESNKAQKSGGGMYISSGNVSIVSGSFQNNTAAENGGGLYSEVPLSSSATEFSFNSADGVGGGLAIESSPSTSSSQLSSTSLQKIQVDGNVATLGGGIHLASLSPVFISAASTIVGNTAIMGGDEGDEYGMGGGLYINASSDALTVDDTTIALNSADRGAGVFIAGPSSSSLVQIRAGCIIERNTATESGGGIELGGPVLYTGFNEATIDYNIVTSESGVGGGLMLRGSAVVSQSFVTGNVAQNGGGIEVDQAGLVTLVDNTVTYNNASDGGGGLRITTSSGVLIKGGEFSSNHAQQGAAAYVGPSLPVEFSSVVFQDNSVSKSGSALYVLGNSQEALGGVNLVKVRNCVLLDSFNEAVYSNGAELVFDESCNINGLTVVADSSISVCDCPSGAEIANLLLEADSGSFLADSNIYASGNFAWQGGEIYGVNSTTCLTGLKAGFDSSDYSIESPPTFTVSGSGLAGTSGSSSLTSKEINWVVEQSLNIGAQQFSVGDSTIRNEGRITLSESETVQCATLYNSGTLQLEKNCVIDATLVQSGVLELRYSSPQTDTTDLASVTNEENQEGSEMKVVAPSPTPLEVGDSFYALKWGKYSGEFSSFSLDSDLADKSRGQLEYSDETLKVEIVKKGAGAGAITGIVIGVLIVVIIIVAGAVFYFRQRSQNAYGEIDESEAQGFAEQTKVLGESGGMVEGKGEQSLIENEHL